MWEHIAATLSGAFIGGGLGAALVNFFLDRWKEQIAAKRGWRVDALSKLYGPLIMQFDRTNRAFDRYQKTDLFLEAEVLKKKQFSNSRPPS